MNACISDRIEAYPRTCPTHRNRSHGFFLFFMVFFLFPLIAGAHTYTLENSGCGGGPYPDNALFTIDGDLLRTAGSFNYENRTSCTICIRTTDDGSATFDREFTITINNVDELPVVTSQAATGINTTSAVGNGTITDLGGPNPTQHGVCWGTSVDPTIAGNRTEEGAVGSTGVFTSTMTGLTPGMLYHYRAYATNTVNTAYGADRTFTTLAAPSVTTQAATNVTDSTAVGNGTITGLGVPNPTQHGVCWGTSANPTVSGNRTEEGAVGSTGAFTGAMTGLTPGTLYHYRAYATNSVDTVYGADQTFTTLVADLSVNKSNNAGGTILLGNDWTWKVRIRNTGTGNAVFTAGQVILTDQLPDSDIDYDGVSIVNAVNITNSGNIGAAIVGNVLTVSASGGSVTIGAATGQFDVDFTATPTGGTSFSNPRSGGSCRVDPNSLIVESNKGNNAAATDTVTVNAPDLTISKTNNVSGQVALGNTWTWTLRVRNSGNGDATFTNGQTMVIDDLPDTNISYSALSITNVTNITNQGNISAVIAGNTLTVSANGGSVVIGDSNGGFDIQFTASPTVSGTYVNPGNGGTCGVDPNTVIAESNESNNAAADTVTVIAPEINLKQGETGIANGGNFDVGGSTMGTNLDIVFTIENEGDDDLIIMTPLTLSGPDAARFSMLNQPGSPVSPSDSMTFTVRFSPVALGAKTAVLSIANNDSDENPYEFTIQGTGTEDNDGANTEIEDLVPSPGGGTGDGNGDGTPDSVQPDVVSLPTYDDGDYATIDVSDQDVVLVNAVTVDPADTDAPMDEITMPYGMFAFEVQGVVSEQTVTISILLPRNTSINSYWKKNVNTGVWEKIPATVDHDSVPDKTLITFDLVNNGDYDSNPADDAIDDPGGPGFQIGGGGTHAVPTLDQWGVLVLCILLIGGGTALMRKRIREEA